LWQAHIYNVTFLLLKNREELVILERSGAKAYVIRISFIYLCTCIYILPSKFISERESQRESPGRLFLSNLPVEWSMYVIYTTQFILTL
jgi:hypothetical protein